MPNPAPPLLSPALPALPGSSALPGGIVPAWRRFGRDRRGGVITLAAIGLPVLAIGVAGAVEIAEVSSARTKMQTYVDSAAMTGAREYMVDQSSATEERTRVVADGFATPLRPRWTVTSTVTTSAATGAVTVTQAGWRPSMFGSLLPPGGFRVGATATAASTARKPLCVLALRTGMPDVLTLGGSSSISASDCLVQSDSDLVASGAAAVRAGAVRTVGAATGAISPAPVTDAPPVADPFAALPINVPAGCTDLVVNLLGGTVTLNPGVHCGSVALVGSGTLKLNPGEHYFVGGSLSLLGNTEIVGTDVVIILKGQSAVQFAGSTTLSLEGRKTGAYAGFVIITDRSFTGTLAISTKNAQKLLGTIYLPNATLEVSGNNNRIADQSPWTVVVAKEIDVKGSADLVINASYSASPIPVPAGVGPGNIQLTR